MNNFSSYGETSGFSAVPAGELELVNGGKGGGGSTSGPNFPGDPMPVDPGPGTETMPWSDGIYEEPPFRSTSYGGDGGGGK